MGFSKKTAKGRLDKYYFLAKDQGYRARSAFKLVQLNKKYNLLDQARVVIDLCAAPGGWLQVAAKYMPASHVIVGVDLVPIKALPGVTTIVADITTDKCRSELNKELKGWKADVVLHDGAPNVGKSWLQDAYSQSELVLHSLKLATEFLAKDGCFVSKVFRSKDYNSLMWVFNQLFSKVEATKPASSRDVSAEIFVICRGYKAPSHIDPRLLDPKSVFEDNVLLQTATKVNLMHPEKTVRHRGGYEDGSTILYKAATIQDFIHSNEPNNILATCNEILVGQDVDPRILEQLDAAKEIREICKDLKVLGRREFKIISKWRKSVRTALNIEEAGKDGNVEVKEENLVEADPLEELESLSRMQKNQDKREKRKGLEKKAKQRMRMQLSMDNTADLADDYANEDSLFSLKTPKIASLPTEDLPLDRLDPYVDTLHGEDDINSSSDEEKGNVNDGENDNRSENDDGLGTSSEEDVTQWEADLERDYQMRKKRQLQKDKVELVRARRGETAELENKSKGVSWADSADGDTTAKSKAKVMPSSSADENSSGEESYENGSAFVTSLMSKEEEREEKDAKIDMWYSNPLFRELEMPAHIEPESSEKKIKKRQAEQANSTKAGSKSKKKKNAPSSEIVFIKADASQSENEEIDEETKAAVLTPSGMTLAAKLAADRKRAAKDLIDDSFNRYSRQNDPTLPKWFLEEESKHNRPQKPITKEGVALLRAKIRQIDAQPIRKVLEAKGRNRQRGLRKLEALKKKAAVIVESEDVGERQKSEQIQKLMAKSKKPQKKETRLVISKGSKRGVKGRPRGVKGHYKMVDSRLKKDMRAMKRIKKTATKGKKGRS